ncbi:hypothetical protein ACFWPH_28280 [Nocardia sp. NPDC058499]|uniref:hypothetical protein n=1 Tax=Nocardia sp. NPDC058499 TaxID=3346530 RepID=UPI003652791B
MLYALTDLDNWPMATLCHRQTPDDLPEIPRPAPDTTRVAVLAIDEDDRGSWKITECPVEALGCYDGEATDIPGTFIGDVVVLDDAPGFPAGCATWAQFSDNVADSDNPHISELTRARAEHWNCQHALFGRSPLEGWTRSTAAAEGPAECWTFDGLCWTATITSGHDEPHTAHLSIAHRDRPSAVDMIPCRSVDDAKRTGISILRSHILAASTAEHP